LIILGEKVSYIILQASDIPVQALCFTTVHGRRMKDNEDKFKQEGSDWR